MFNSFSIELLHTKGKIYQLGEPQCAVLLRLVFFSPKMRREKRCDAVDEQLVCEISDNFSKENCARFARYMYTASFIALGCVEIC